MYSNDILAYIRQFKCIFLYYHRALYFCISNYFITTLFMIKKQLLIYTCALISLATGIAQAQVQSLETSLETPVDSLRAIDLEGLEVNAYSLQSSRPVELQPLSATQLNQRSLDRYAITDITRLTSRVPSLYIPDYGSKFSTAIYLRGVGTRSSGQTIGFYVDGVPYLSKSAFNFDLVGIRSIEVLRGPQGTLYGRNAMAGIVNLYTKSAFTDPGMSALVSYGSYNDVRTQAEYHTRLSEKWGLNVGGSLHRRDGYRYNETRRAYQDSLLTASTLVKLEYRPSNAFRSTLSVSYDYVSQGAFPYQRIDPKTNALLPLDSNEPGSYKRNSLSLRLRTIWRGEWWRLESGTGYHHLADRTSMDMDASRVPMFFVEQRSKQHTLTQELVLRNLDDDERVHWSWGVFGYYDRGQIEAPVLLRPAGISGLVQRGLDQLSKSNPKIPKLQVDASHQVHNSNSFTKPEMGVALYYEGMVKDFFVRGLDLTAGIRFDYSRQEINYDSQMAMAIRPVQPSPAKELPFRTTTTHLVGTASQGGWQVLPKLAVQYNLGYGKVFASVSKGYKSGGYNEQTLTEVIRQVNIQDALKSGKTMTSAELGKRLAYQPEKAWSYELGLKLRSLGIVDRLHLSAYYTDVTNLQITNFVQSGAGRMISNAGRSYSLGAEASVAVSLIGDQLAGRDYLGMNLNYGFTYARLKGGERELRVPYIPEHTYSAMLLVAKEFGHHVRLFSEIELSGLSNIYWTEDNSIKEPTYALLSARLGTSYKGITLSLYGKNLLDKQYTAFHARTIGSMMMQLGAPRTLGVELGFKL